MDSLTQLLCLDVQFDTVSAENATETVTGAAALPEFGASCGPRATTRISCQCGGDPCADPTIISAEENI